MTACTCRERIDAKLAEHNTRITRAYSLEESGLSMLWIISTTQIETGRGKPKALSLQASFCPFCGVSLAKPANAEEVAGA